MCHLFVAFCRLVLVCVGCVAWLCVALARSNPVVVHTRLLRNVSPPRFCLFGCVVALRVTAVAQRRSKTVHGHVMPPPVPPRSPPRSPPRVSPRARQFRCAGSALVPTPSRAAGVLVVALTGGPCAGKSTALSYLSDQLSRRGCAVHTCVEAATLGLPNFVACDVL